MTRALPASLLLILLLLLPVGHGTNVSSASPTFSVSLSASRASGNAPLFVTFSVTVLSGVPTGYNWSFGDGSYYNGSAALQYASPTHEYPNPGSYRASVRVWEGNLSAEGGPLTITVDHAPIILHAAATPTVGYVPLTVVFNATVSGGTGTYTVFQWNFGDGGSGTGTVVTHSYPRAGVYHATLTVADSSGATANTTVNVTVNSPGATGDVGSGNPVWWILLGFAVGLLVALLAVFLGRRREPKGPPPPEPVAPTPPDPEGAPVPVVESPPAGASPVPGSSPAGPPPGASAITLSQRVVVHLAQQGMVNLNELIPPEFTQGGIARSLGMKQNVLTNVLRRLEEAGILISSVTHVKGELRRLKVYRLTAQGEALAREIRRRKS